MSTIRSRADHLADADLLRARIDGHLVLPDEDGWDAARVAWNLHADQRPAAVVYPASADDVAAVIDHARVHGLRVAPQGTGHFALPLGSLHGTILLRTSRLRGIEIDPSGRRARAEAGVLWQELVAAAAEHGLAALAGSSPDVGVVGYTLGGGVGWLGRRYGLAANSVTAVELVTADGILVRVDADVESELFWALRGGGGSFGVVTAIEFVLYPLEQVYAGALFWPIERAAEVLHAWRDWTETVPDEVSSVGRLLRLPPIPEVPEPLRGRSFVIVEAAFLGDEGSSARLLGSLRALGPELDTFAVMPAPALEKVHMDPEQPVPGVGDGTLLAAFPPDAVDALVRAAGPESGSSLVSVELRHLGGAIARPSADQGAVGAIDAAFALYSVGTALDDDMATSMRAQAAAVRAALAPWEAERTYFNFTERPVDGSAIFGEAAHRRLRRIKAAVDPGELFQVVHPIVPEA
jgi:UDP-N-acetylenolpyruvoylglucosamine reductase